MSIPRRSRPNKHQQLCWCCQRSAAPPGIQCEWDAFGTPVPGWKAEPKMIPRSPHPPMQSYQIYDCPKFLEMENYAK